MRNTIVGLFIISLIVFANPHSAWAGGDCDKVSHYFAVLSDAARIDPQGAETIMGRTRNHFIARTNQANSGGMKDSQCRQFAAGVQQNWDTNIQGIFPKLKKTQRPSRGSQTSCARAFMIISNFTLKEQSPNIFAVYVWAANTALVEPKDCQWIVNAYS